MQHFLLTRFNIRIERWRATRDGHETRSQEWLENRINLFEKYCLPSVVNQRNQDFIWCVAMDDQTPDEYKKQMRQLLEPFEHFHIIYVSPHIPDIRRYMAFVQRKLNPATRYVITTRLDNDDLVHEVFIDAIQKLFQEQNGLLIDLENGYQIVNLDKKQQIRLYDRPYYHFISLVEKADQFQTVYRRQHNDWRDYSPVKTIKDQRLWAELLHSHNMANKIRESAYMTTKFDHRAFGLHSSPEIKTSNLACAIQNARIFLRNSINALYNKLN